MLSRAGDPLVHHGRHFGRTVHAMCNIQALVTNDILRAVEDREVAEETLTLEFVPLFLTSRISHLMCPYPNCRARKEHRVLQKLLRMIPHLAERLTEASEEEIMVMANLVSRLMASASSTLYSHLEAPEGYIQCKIRRYKKFKRRCFGLDNSKGRPSASPPLQECQNEQGLPSSRYRSASLPRWLRLGGSRVSVFDPLLSYSSSTLFRVRAKLSSGELVVCGDQWPILMYANQEYDPEDPWNGLLRSRLLVWVRFCLPLALLVITESWAGRRTSMSSPHPVLWKRK